MKEKPGVEKPIEKPAEKQAEKPVEQPIDKPVVKPAGAGVAPAPATFYTIQVAASETWLEPGYFTRKFNLTDSVWSFQKDGWYKYAVGRYPNSGEAEAYRIKKAIPGFVTKVDPLTLTR